MLSRQRVSPRLLLVELVFHSSRNVLVSHKIEAAFTYHLKSLCIDVIRADFETFAYRPHLNVTGI